MKPRALDLFCGAGGAAMGLHQAGFEVVGVDIRPQPRYPFEFHQADAMTFALEGFDFIWASPPCQRFSRMTKRWGKAQTDSHPDFVAPIRARLESAGGAWVIENVGGAPLKWSVLLCGSMFGLKVWRHRWFEPSHMILAPQHQKHNGTTGARSQYTHAGYYGGINGYITVAGNSFQTALGRAAMGIDWMNRPELAEAIPPAYSRYIGEQMMPHVLRQMETGGVKCGSSNPQREGMGIA